MIEVVVLPDGAEVTAGAEVFSPPLVTAALVVSDLTVLLFFVVAEVTIASFLLIDVPLKSACAPSLR